MKTPEQMAEEYCERRANTDNFDVSKAFLAGYKAAKDEDAAKIKELEIQLELWKHDAIYGDERL